MKRQPLALAIALALATSSLLYGCDSTSHLTEQEHIQRAKDFEDRGDLQGSIIELKNAIQKNPENPQARFLLGQVYLKAGRGAEAEKELPQAEKLGVSRESTKLYLGETWLLMGEYNKVLDEVSPHEGATRDTLGRILQLRAEALFRQGNAKDACNLFEQSLEANSSYPPIYWGLAQCAVAGRDLAKAGEYLSAALKINDRRAKTWIFVGDLEGIGGNRQAALAAYTNALKAEPENLEALQGHALLSMSLGDMNSAQKDVEKANELAPRTVGSFYLQAAYSFHQKKYSKARDALQELFKITPDHMPSVLLAGVTSYELGSYQQAESYLNRFLSNYPGHDQARRALAATQIKQKQPAKALETLAPLLSPGSTDAQAFALAGQAYLAKGETTRATEYFEKAAAIDPQNASLHTQLGMSRLATGNFPLAVNALQAAAGLSTNQSLADSLLIAAFLDRKQYDNALASIDVLEKKLPDSPVPHNFRGTAYLGKKDIASARRSFEKALAIDPAFFPAAASLAQLDMLDKDPETARKRFERVLAQNENDLQAMLALAQLAAINKSEKESVSWLEKAAKAHPTALRPYQLLATFYLGKSENQKAIAYAREGLDNNPENPEALNLLGTTQVAAGEHANALETYTRLAEKTPGSAAAYYKLAQVQIGADRTEAARKSLRRSLDLAPGYGPAQDALMELEVKAGNPEDALRIARQIQASQPKSPLGLTRQGDILGGMKRYQEAAKAYEKASLLGRDTALMIKWHRAVSLAGDSTAADARIIQWLREHPLDFAARSYLAQTYMHSSRITEAVSQYEELLRSFPQDLVSLNNLAALYLRMQDARALATAERAFKLAPQNPAVLDTLGWILVSSGQADAGLPLLKKAVAAAPAEASIRYHLAVGYAKTGNKAQAKKELEQLLKTKENFPELAAARTLLLEL